MIKKKLVLGIIALTLMGGCIGANAYNKVEHQKLVEQQKIEAQKLEEEKAKKIEEEKKEEAKRIEEEKKLAEEKAEKERLEKERIDKERVEKLEKEKQAKAQQEKIEKEKEINNTKSQAKNENKSKSKKKDVSVSKKQNSTPAVKKEKHIKPEKIGYVYLDGAGATEELANLTNTYLSYVPKNIMNKFVADGWKVVLTDKNIAKTYYHNTSLGKIVGLTVSEDKTIYILATQNAIKSATIHEIGHFVDIQRDVPSSSEEFLADFNNEKNTFEVYSYDGHYKRNHFEFFAEVFQESILNPDRCKRTAPKTYEFVRKQAGLI